MATTKYAHLLAAGRIGGLALRNRIAVTAMGVGLAEPDGHCGERIIRYHEEQAKGGAGLIITGASGVAWPVGGVLAGQVAVSDDRFLPGLQALVDAVHAHGAKLAFQLHNGGPVSSQDMLSGRPVNTPSLPVPSLPDLFDTFLLEELQRSFFGQVTSVDFHEMTVDDIATAVAQFAAAADRVKRAGADGVEIHGGHGYLLSAFLSPATNRRTDAYGGPLENRARLLLEVLGAVRQAVGHDFPVWVKLDSREVGRHGGITIDDAVATARLLEAAGADAITVTAYHDTDRGVLHSASHTPQEPGVNIPFAARIKAAGGMPVIVSGRIEPAQADAVIAEGRADFVAMGRKLLADPALPIKLLQGREDDVRPCIYCYTCISAIYTGDSARCAVNPRTAFEYLPPPPAVTVPKHVVVVGGGPGGMEAASQLDARGHRVTLLEKSPRLGGTLRFASLGYEPNEKLLDWLTRRIEASKVTVRLQTEATPALLRELAPDVVVVGTGAARHLPALPGSDLPHVFSGEDLRRLVLGEDSAELARKTGLVTRLATKVAAATGASGSPALVRQSSRVWMPLGQRIVIIGGELVGLELAEFLSDRGRQVTVVDDIARLGTGLPVVRRMALLDQLRQHGVALHRQAADIRITREAVVFTDGQGQTQAVPADHVIVAKGATADLRLAEALRAAGFDVRTVGDCEGVGYIEGAIHGAARVAAHI